MASRAPSHQVSRETHRGRVEVCQACGQTLPPPFIHLGLQPTAQRLVEAIYEGGRYGISVERLMDKLYGDDPEGGPLYGKRSVQTRICQLNRKLRLKGWRIQGDRCKPTSYRLIKIELPAEATADLIREKIR